MNPIPNWVDLKTIAKLQGGRLERRRARDNGGWPVLRRNCARSDWVVAYGNPEYIYQIEVCCKRLVPVVALRFIQHGPRPRT